MNEKETNKLKQMALDAMIKAIDDAMKEAKEKEEHARQWIEQDAKSGTLNAGEIVNRGQDIKEAQIAQMALREAHSYMCLYLNA